ncbi:MAG: enoyl-CoA hydratase-related protein [Armatimonadota bacterium]|nr:enoyl-CoA hydratase-related protein [Armatimonadota bacterium]MDR5697493.1 enoyl-CoA hydratase-related protein [Armatimonadota bacterium]
MSTYETILYEVSDGVLTVTLNRPEVLNAFNDRMSHEVQDALRRAERDKAVRCVVVTGAGKGFCSGQDLRDRAGDESFSFVDSLRRRYNPIILKLRTIEKPVIAAVNGVAAGAGCSLALAADLRIASETASFIEVFARVGLVPDSGSTYFLPRLVGLGKAFEMCYLTDPVSADEAARIGLVNWVVPPAQLEAKTREVAGRLSRGPTRAYALTKRAINRNLFSDLDSALDYEAMVQEIAGRTSDHREGVAAFLAKRAPSYLGR